MFSVFLNTLFIEHAGDMWQSFQFHPFLLGVQALSIAVVQADQAEGPPQNG